MAQDATLRDRFTEHRLTPAQRRIAQYLLADRAGAAFLTSIELAERADVSQPTVTRFVSLLGFGGYGEFRRFLRESDVPERGHGKKNKLQEGVADDCENVATLGEQLADRRHVAKVGKLLARSVPLVVAGFRVSAPAASLFGYLAAKIHPDVRMLVDGGSVAGDRILHARRAGANVLLAYALPRYPREMRQALEIARTQGMRVVLVTDKPVTALTDHADEVLSAPVSSELLFDSHAAVVSLSVALLETMADALGAPAQRRLESFEDYAIRNDVFLPE